MGAWSLLMFAKDQRLHNANLQASAHADQPSQVGRKLSDRPSVLCFLHSPPENGLQVPAMRPHHKP